MKDFKTLPKMKCGGGVKKYQTGGNVLDDIRAASKAGKLVDRMPAPIRNDGTNPALSRAIGAPEDSKYVDRMPIPAPSDTVAIPGVGRVPRPALKTTPSGAALLKKGGKVKRGTVSKRK